MAQAYIQKNGEYNLLTVTEKGWRALKGLETPRLLKPVKKPPKPKTARIVRDSWEGVDKDLFQILRKIRLKLASEKGYPAYIIFSDAVLRDMARKKPTCTRDFLNIKGVGDMKCDEYGDIFIGAIRDYVSVKRRTG